jgi:hypothetical protein
MLLSLYCFKDELHSIKLGISSRLKIETPDIDRFVGFVRVIGKVENGLFKKISNNIDNLNTNKPVVVLNNKEFNNKEFNKYIKNCLVVTIKKYPSHVINKYKLFSDFGLDIKDTKSINSNKRSYYYNANGEKKVIKIQGALIGRTKVYLAYRQAILDQLKELWTGGMIDYDSFEIPKEWKDEQKRIAKENRVIIEKAQGVISIKDIITGIRNDLNLATLNGYTGLIIYGYLQNKDRLALVKNVMNSIKTIAPFKNLNSNIIRIYQIAQNNETPFLRFKNSIHVNNFFMSNNRLMNKLYTCYLIHTKINNSKINKCILKTINFTMGTYLEDITKYYDNNINSSLFTRLVQNEPEFIKELESNAKLLNLGDKSIMYKLDALEEYFKGLEILKHAEWNLMTENLLVKAFKLAGKKVNYYHYNNQSEKVELKQAISTPWIGGLIERPYQDLRAYNKNTI